jgi:hypothetical protein
MKYTYLIIVFLFVTLSYSQFNNSAPWMKVEENSKKNVETIDELVNSFNKYWETHDRFKKGSGYKPFMRWENHWRNMTNPLGYLITPQEMHDAWMLKNQSKLNRTFSPNSLPVSNWQPIGPISNANENSTRARGRVNVVQVDPSNPNTIYMGTPAGGIWKSINSGTSWIPLSDELPQIGVSGIAVDYSNSNTIYIATGDKDASDTYSIGVMKSINGGATWSTTGLSFFDTNTTAGDLLIHPTNNQILWCATSVGLYKTTNGGTSWNVVQTGNFSQGSIRLKPGDPTTVYAVSKNSFYKSTNTGTSFTQITTGLPASSGRMIMDVTAANNAYVYILSSTNSNGFQGIYRSTNGGTSFTKTSGTTNILESTQAWYDLALAVSSTNENELYTGCLNIWKSVNGGANSSAINSWFNYSPSFTHADIHFLGFFNNKLYCGSDGGIYVSNNSGASFADITGEAQIGQFYKISVAKQTASKIAGGLQDNGGFAYNNDLWRDYHGGDGMDNVINPVDNNMYYGFIYFGNSLYISSNSGGSISSSVSAPSGESGNWVTPLVANNSGEIFSGFTKLFKLNGGAWTQQSSGTIGFGNVDYIEVAPSNNDVMFVSNGTELYKSINHGVDFFQVYSANSDITSIEVNYSDSNIVYLTTGGINGQVLKSINGGVDFNDITAGVPDIGKNIIVHQGRNTNNPLFLGTSLGVYYLDDSMTAWEPFDTNLPNVSVTDLEINLEDAKLIAATYGRGVWQANIPIQVPNTDVKYVNTTSQISLSCDSNVNATVKVKNNGLTNLSQIVIDYSINSNNLQHTWSGTLVPNAIADIALPVIALPKGVYTLIVNSTTTGDEYSDNNSGAIIVYTNNSGTVGITNTFTNTSDSLLTFTEGKTTSQWVRGVNNNGVMSSGGNTVYTTNLTGDYPNLIKSYLVSQCYDLTNVANPQISFKMKFDLEQNWDIVYVEYSTNLGANWNVLGTMGTGWYNSDRTEFTSGSDCYNCTGAQWTGTNTTSTTYSYPLNTLVGQSNVIFRIVFHTDESSTQLGVTIDDFLISGTLGNQEIELNNVFIHPNPSNGIYNVSLGNIIPTLIEVYDLMGKRIYSNNDIHVSNKEIAIDISSASTGVYFIKIKTEQESTVKRILKE